MPVIGFLNAASPDTIADRLRAFRQGLKETGYVEGENVAIEYRWAENQIERLPALAAELVRRQVAVIAAGVRRCGAGGQSGDNDDPHRVLGPRRPGQTWSGRQPRPAGRQPDRHQFFVGELVAKRLELLRELVPAAIALAVLVNPANPRAIETTLRDVEAAARAMGLQVQVLNASTSREIDEAFATICARAVRRALCRRRPFFISRRVQLANSRHVTRFPRHMRCARLSRPAG